VIALRVAFRDEAQDGALHPKVEQLEVTDDGDGEHPDSPGYVAQTMQDERGKEEPDCHIGDGSKPIKQHVPGDVSCTQLQATSPEMSLLCGRLSFKYL
jgi:hypothetical protein